MQWENNPFTDLALQVRLGEPGAAGQFRQEMKPCLEHMVRRVLRRGKGPAPLAPRILAEAGRILARAGGADAPTSDDVVDQVATRLCDGMIDQLQRGSRLEDTWAPVGAAAFAATQMTFC
jgi:hypothetical protein